MCSGKGEGGERYMWRGEWVGGVYREEEGRKVMWEACEGNVYMCTVRRVYLYDCACASVQWILAYPNLFYPNARFMRNKLAGYVIFT